MRKIIVLLLFLSVFKNVFAHDKLDSTIKDELKKPGVKLVAIDFYMTGCPPCDKAIPKWNNLKRRYGNALTVIVVAPTRDDGSCNIKGFQGVKMICDDKNKISSHWGVKDFPQAFLYSWHNDDPLVQLGTVKDVEKSIVEYFKHVPRVLVYTEGNEEELVPMVEKALIMNSKIEVVVNKSERAKLLKIAEISTNPQYDDELQCEFGKEISPNSLLRIEKSNDYLSLKLSSAEKGCWNAVTMTPLIDNSDNLQTEVNSAVYELLSQIFGNISTPNEGADQAKTTYSIIEPESTYQAEKPTSKLKEEKYEEEDEEKYNEKDEEKYDFGRITLGILRTIDDEDFGISLSYAIYLNSGNLHAGFGLGLKGIFSGNVVIGPIFGLGYNVYLSTDSLKAIGLWCTAGAGIDLLNADKGFVLPYELGFDMIFSGGLIIDIGFGGFPGSNKYMKDKNNFFLNIGKAF